MASLELDFVGPYSFVDGEITLFKAPCASSAGVYLWTIRQQNDGSHLIHYVGETTSIAKRHREHLINILGLNYGIFDAGKAQTGISELIWPGLWRDKTLDGPSRQIQAYGIMHDRVLSYLSTLNIFFAEVNVERALRKHIEGCIGWNLRNKHPEAKMLYPDDNHVGTMDNKNHGVLLIRAAEQIRGLDTEITY